MNEQTKLELLKIAATLTHVRVGDSSKHESDIKKHFENYCFYLFENYEQLGSVKNITVKEDSSS